MTGSFPSSVSSPAPPAPQGVPARSKKPLILSIVAAALLYAVATIASNRNEVWEGLTKLHLGTWAVLLSLPLIAYLVRFLRWTWYIKLLGHSVPALPHLQIYLAGFALTTTPGKVGETVRSVFLLPHGVPIRSSMAAFIAERFTDTAAVAFLAVLVSYRFQDYGWLVPVSVAVLGILLWVFRSQRLLDWMETFGSKPGLGRLRKVVSGTAHALESCRVLLSSRFLVGGLVLGLVAWGMEGIGFWVVLNALDLAVSVPTAVGVYSIGTLIGALSFIPGGIGAMEGTLSVLLVILGVPLAGAVSATIVIRIATLWFALSLGGIFIASLSRTGTS